jgi:hypothetical protein
MTPWVILAIIVIVLLYVADWVQRHPPAGTLIGVTFCGFIALLIYRRISNSNWNQERIAAQLKSETARQAALETKSVQREQTTQREARAKSWETQPYKFPTTEEFASAIRNAYNVHSIKQLRGEYAIMVIGLLTFAYGRARFDRTKLSTDEAKEIVAVITDCCVKGIVAFTDEIDQRLLAVDEPKSVFSIPISHLDCVGTYIQNKEDEPIWKFNDGQFEAFELLADPFRDKQRKLSPVYDFSNYTYDFRPPPIAGNYELRSEYNRELRKYEDECEQITAAFQE